MTYAISRITVLLFAVAFLSACGAMKFITDSGKLHFQNESRYDVTITVDEPGEDLETFTLAPGKEKMVSVDGYTEITYSPSDQVRYERREESWWDSYWNTMRMDVYYHYYDR